MQYFDWLDTGTAEVQGCEWRLPLWMFNFLRVSSTLPLLRITRVFKGGIQMIISTVEMQRALEPAQCNPQTLSESTVKYTV